MMMMMMVKDDSDDGDDDILATVIVFIIPQSIYQYINSYPIAVLIVNSSSSSRSNHDTCIDTISDNKVTLSRCSSVSIESMTT